MLDRTRLSLGWGVAAALSLVFFALLGVLALQRTGGGSMLTFQEFTALVQQDAVQRVVVRGDVATVSLREGQQGSGSGDRRVWRVKPPGSAVLANSPLVTQLNGQGVELRFESGRGWLTAFLNVLPLLLLGLFGLALLVAVVILAVRRP